MGSIAHAQMLCRIGILTQQECDSIIAGLEDIERDIENGSFTWSSASRTFTMNIEAELTRRIGEAGKKLHTARSRNDQVATDMRLYLRDAVDSLTREIHQLQSTLLDIAEREADTLMPGLTHLQVAQPVTFGHHLMAWFEMLQRGTVNVLMKPGGASISCRWAPPRWRAHLFLLIETQPSAALGFDAASEKLSGRGVGPGFCC